jgi:hypothetical protein
MRNFPRRATIGLDIQDAIPPSPLSSGIEYNFPGINYTTISDLLTGSNELDNGIGFDENDTIIINRARITTLPNLNSFGGNLLLPVHLSVGMGGPFTQHIERLTITVGNLWEWVDVGMPIPNREDNKSKFITLSSDNAKIFTGNNIPAFAGGALTLNFELDVTYNKGSI